MTKLLWTSQGVRSCRSLTESCVLPVYIAPHCDRVRTYQEYEFFQLESTQKLLSQILYIWAAMHPRLSYKQGMNELLAPLVFVASQEYFKSVTYSDVLDLGTDLKLRGGAGEAH